MNLYRVGCFAVAATLIVGAREPIRRIVHPEIAASTCCLQPGGPCVPWVLAWLCPSPKEPKPAPKPKVEPRGPSPYGTRQR